jgi:hypothetical protein
MFNLNLDKNKIYRIHYVIDETEYFSFSKIHNDDFFIDVITNNIYDADKINRINYSDINLKVFKYFSKLYTKEKNIHLFKCSNYDENILLYVDVLRFFNLKLSDLTQNNKSIFLIKKTISKIEKYLKRYFDNKIVNNYINYIKMFDDINYILSYKPYELLSSNNVDKLFWVEKFTSNINFKSKVFEIKKNIFESCILTNLNLNDNINDTSLIEIEMKKLIKIEEQNLINFKKESEKKYKEEITSNLLDRIKKAKETLTKETDYAKTVNDEDLLFEINVIIDSIKETEEKVFTIIKNINLATDVNCFWPDILYPLPDLTDFFKKINDEIKRIDDRILFLNECIRF